MSRATVNRLASATPVVADAKQNVLVQATVEALFTPDYLRARGLSPDEVAVHNRLVVGALTSLAEQWDGTAALVNQLDPAMIPDGIAPWLAMEALLDAAVRCAAYLCLHGRLCPAIDQIGRWTSGPGVKPCLTWLRGLARRSITSDRVCRLAKITKNAWVSLKEGRTLPRDDTIDRLAHAFETFDLHLGTDRLTAAEIGLALRTACAAAELVRWGRASPRRAHAIDFHLGNLRFFRSDLRRYPPVDLAETIAKGSTSKRWSEIHARLLMASHATAVRALRQQEARVAACARDLYSIREADRTAALRRMADQYEAERQAARELFPPPRERDQGPGGDMMRMMDFFGQVLRSLAGGSPVPESVPVPCVDQLQAKLLSDTAYIPWNGLTPEQREATHWRAVETDPASPYARKRLADHLATDPAQAEESLNQYRLALTLDEGYDDAHLAFSLKLASLNRYEDAIAELDTLIVRGVKTATILGLRGVCLEELGRVTEAEASFGQARAIDPRDVRALEGLARCRRAQGDAVGARKLEREAEFHRTGRHRTTR